MYSVFVLGIFLYILAFFGYIQAVYQLNLKKNYVSGRERIVSEFAQSLYSEANIINNMSLSIIRNESVREYLKASNPSLAQKNTAQKELYQLIYTSEPIESVYVVHTQKEEISINYVGSDATRKLNFSSEWRKMLENYNGKWIMNLNGAGAFQNMEYPILSHMRAILDLDTQKLIGYAVINLSMDFFEQQIEQFWQERDTFIGIRSADYGMLAQKGNEWALEQCYESFHQDLKEEICTQTAGKYLIVQQILENWGLEIVYITEAGFGQIFSNTFLWFGIIILAVTILFLLLLGMVMSQIITKPITTLVAYMEKVQSGYLYRVNFKTNNDEIGILKDSYNKMLVRINQLITDLVEEERRKNKMELDILQEQINPHFLYNTLSSIEYLTLIQDNQGAYEALQTLSSFYRNFLSGGSQTIMLQQELEIASDYIKLQKLRFKDIVELKISVQESLLSKKVLRLILQPLVENALMHGIYPKGESGIIQLQVEETEYGMKMIIEDNGVGMDVENIQNLLRREKGKEEKHFGLQGTLLRIGYFYNVKDFYKMESEKGKYTRIILDLPFL